MKQYKSCSAEIPAEWDLTSSQTTVYHNTNITHENRDVMGEEVGMFYYDVEEYTKAEYESKLLKQNRADIDYISAMTGVII